MSESKKNGYAIMLVASLVFLQACATDPRYSIGTFMPPPVPVPGTAATVEEPGPIRSIGVLRSGIMSGGFGFYSFKVRPGQTIINLETEVGKDLSIATSNSTESGIMNGAGKAGAAIYFSTGSLSLAAAPIAIALVPVALISSYKSAKQRKNLEALMVFAEESLGYKAVQEVLVDKIVESSDVSETIRLVDVKDPCKSSNDCPEIAWQEQGLDAVLNVQVFAVGLAGEKGEEGLRFVVDGRASLLRASDGEVIRTRPFAVRGFSLSVESWVDPEKDLLASQYENYMDALAEQIVEVMVFQTDLAPVTGGKYCWMSPIEPEGKRFLKFIDNLTPLLSWTPFTGYTDDGQPAGHSPGRITDIVYDLRVTSWVAGLVYERTGLTDSSHVIEESLIIAPHKINGWANSGWGKIFLWSVRARFKEDGIEKRTGWARHLPRGDLPLGWTVVPHDNKEVMWNQEWYLTEDMKKDLSQEAIAMAKCTGGAGGFFRFEYRAPQKTSK
jgi:hypothetical protein